MTERQVASLAHEVVWREGAPPVTFMDCGVGVRSAYWLANDRLAVADEGAIGSGA